MKGMRASDLETAEHLGEQGEQKNWPQKTGLSTLFGAAKPDLGVTSTVVASLASAALPPMKEAVRALLQCIGEDPGREGILKTPLRVATAFLSAFRGYKMTAEEIVGPALFSEVGTHGGSGCGGGSGGMVVVKNIDSFAICESCLLPFRIRCHVAYIPCGERVVGLSKLPRVAEIFAKRLQTPQKFANEVAQALKDSFQPLGVGVITETWHLQWPGESHAHAKGRTGGPEELGSWVSASVIAGKGIFEDTQSALWDEFLAILQVDGLHVTRPDHKIWKQCPFPNHDGANFNSTAGIEPSTIAASAATMAVGVESLLQASGAFGISIDELERSAVMFVKWLVSATMGSRGLRPADLVTFPEFSSSPDSDDQLPHAILGNGRYGIELNGDDSFIVKEFQSPRHDFDSIPPAFSNGSLKANGSLKVNGIVNVNGCLNGHGHLNGNGYLNGNGSLHLNGNGSLSPLERSASDHMEGVLVELAIPLTSLCEHHLLPFFGVVHVGYIVHGGKSLRIHRSALLRVVTTYSRQLQVQERLTRQIAENVFETGALHGAMVVIEASHMCILSRGVEKLGSSTSTTATIGTFSTDKALRVGFLKTISNVSTFKQRTQ